MHLPSTQAPCVHLDPSEHQALEDRYACLAFDAMGCRFEFLIDIEGTRLNRCETQAIAEEMRDIVLDWHHRLSIFDQTSDTSQINRTSANIPIVLDDDMYSLIALCDQLRIKTGGAFNIAAGTLMHAHGFRDPNSKPTPLLHGIDLENAFTLDHDLRSITKSNDLISLDFGAIAKGFVLDLIRKELQELGVQNAFIHGGTSSILAMGVNQKARPWKMNAGDAYPISLGNLSAGVSENNSQSVSHNAQLIGHVMDPRTNAPSNSTISRAVCIHPSAAAADAYSTALSVYPSLADQLTNEPCTLIAFDSSIPPRIHDPLGVVQIKRPIK